MAVELKEVEFDCPFCGQAKKTFISSGKQAEVAARIKRMQEIFNPSVFDATYREIFISKICSNCQKQTFGGEENDPVYDVDVNAPSAEVNAVIGRITEMYDNDKE